ncbi:Na/Pi symporter [Allobacillus sp. GCM10007491]|uniref:Na/Pi cotransporter family protein n=1 Tax=Allobacillus saliphilus TaxID=2912308 RepID=A0A941HT28_9BACI|nr:Na/Pi symporter [Allobacillus saliphilus]MBR7553330.1 Na/Pi cotransporter family protein [Allobacillus saliphilus]
MYLMILMIATYIGIFLFGILLMRVGFENISMQTIKSVRPNPSIYAGLLMGFLLTLLLQSSSVSIALLISFYAAYRLSIPFAICFIIGANIGTTLTAQLFIWNNEHLMIACLLIGFICLVSQKRNIFFIGTILFGMGVVFSALGGLEQLSNQIPKNSYMAIQNGQIDHPFILLLFGAAITSIIQSSTAFTGILISFSGGGSIPLLDIYYLLLGANIGTCLTVILVGLSHKPKLRIIAYIHIWINVIGSVVFFYPGIGQVFVNTVSAISDHPGQQIILLAFLYNLSVGLLIFILHKPFARLLEELYLRQASWSNSVTQKNIKKQRAS